MFNEASLRLILFIGLLLVFVIGEFFFPRRENNPSRTRRWSSNLGLVVIDTLLLRLIFPAAAVGVAAFVQPQDIGLLHWLGVQGVIAGIIGFLLLDIAIYTQHIIFHKIPLFWRLHRVHHSDVEYDVTTGVRFHPIEILLSMLIKMGLIIALGISPVAVFLFEIFLSSTSLFNHSNIKLPLKLDRYLRWFIVTPDMHRVHHSIIRQETDSNFGFNIPWWDRLFGTYIDQPRDGHLDMEIGLKQFREDRQQVLDQLLLQPFRRRQEAR